MVCGVNELEGDEMSNEKNVLNLDEKQKQCVEYLDGPLLMVAGAGSGKTATMLYRLQQIWNERTTKTLAITFTVKAANEMKERLGAIPRGSFIGTIHSFCNRFFIRSKYILELGFTKTPVPYRGDEQLFILYREQKHHPFHAYCADKETLADMIIQLQWYLNRYGKIPEGSDYEAYRLLHDLMRKVNIKYNKISFDDMLLYSLEILDNHPEYGEKLNETFPYLMIDEYQDVNLLQQEIFLKIAGRNPNICVVGDANQSIYAFRGAVIDLILNFQTIYPDAKVITLENNYRSFHDVIELANLNISHNRKKSELEMRAIRGKSKNSSVKVIEVPTPYYEAREVVNRLRELSIDELEDSAVLFRLNEFALYIEQFLILNDVPYRYYKKGGMFEHPIIKLSCSMFQYFEDRSMASIEEFLDLLCYEYVPYKTRESLKDILLRSNKTDPLEALIEAYPSIKNKPLLYEKDNWKRAGYYIYETITAYPEAPQNTTDLISSVVAFYMNYIKTIADSKDDQATLQVDIPAIRSTDYFRVFYEMICFSSHKLKPAGILKIIQQWRNQANQKKGVELLTIHSAKGLEWKRVFIIGNINHPSFHRMQKEKEKCIEEQMELLEIMEEMDAEKEPIRYRNFDKRLQETIEQINECTEYQEEERRVWYVAMTRAKEELYLLKPENNTFEYFKDLSPLLPSKNEPFTTKRIKQPIGGYLNGQCPFFFPEDELGDEDVPF